MSFVRPLTDRLCRVVSRELVNYGRALNDLIFPWSCLLCGTEEPELLGPLCSSCRSSLLRTATTAGSVACPRCALPTGPFADLIRGCSECRGRSLGFDTAVALAPYADSLRDLCLMLKHEQNAWLAPWLARLLAEARHEDFTKLPRDTWIIPVPLHWRRRLWRGYNQSHALAQELSHILGLRVRRPLRRVKATDRLSRKTASERTAAMRMAFRALPDLGLRGRTILLVDDVLTTGATCGAAARALKREGAKHVAVAVLARTL